MPAGDSHRTARRRQDRLAVELGRTVREDFPDGVWLVELGALGAEADVISGLSSALAIREPGRPVTGPTDGPASTTYEAIVLQLRARRALLILDNCEHLVAAVAKLVGPLLAACPELHVLATSREPLAVSGEVSGRFHRSGCRSQTSPARVSCFVAKRSGSSRTVQSTRIRRLP